MALPRLNNTKFGALVVGLTAVPLPSNSFAPKESLLVQNMSAGKLFWGSDASVTIATGFPSIPNIALDYGGPVFLISDTAGQDVRYITLY